MKRGDLLQTHTPNKKIAFRKLRNDVIFILSLLFLFSAVGLTVILTGESGDTVTVTVNKTVFGEYPLNRDTVVEIRANGHLNILVIKDGHAFVESADCPDGICASHRPISRDGESIICLPNKVVISVSANDENTPDIIV